MAGMHAKALSGFPDVRLVGVCDKANESAAAFAREHGRGELTVYDTFQSMLDGARPDALYVCIPPFAHGDEVEEAARRGIHVFVEKPIALSAERARSMVEAVESAGVKSQVGFQMRFHPAVMELKRRIEAGQAGRPVLFTGRYWTALDGKSWWKDRACSGGQILEQAIHIYDLAAHLMGEARLSLATGYLANVAHRDDPSYRIEDVSIGLLPLVQSGACVVTGCNAARAMHFIADFRAVFDRVMLDYRCAGQSWITPDAATMSCGEEIVAEWSDPVDLTRAIDADFIGSIHENRPPAVPIREGLRAIEWVEAVTRNPIDNTSKQKG